MDFSYRFPAVKGRQAGRDYYIAMIPLRMIEKLFVNEVESIPVEYRSQRKLNKTRIPGIRQYILENRNSYVFSALSASIDGSFYFEETKPHDIGILNVSMDAKFLINDGQHRKAALLEAIKEDDSLLDETISVVFYEDQGLARSQQMFTDFNKYAVKTSNSLSVLYDSRDPIAIITRKVVSDIPFLDEYTDKETDNLGKLAHCFFTLNTFYKANKLLFSQHTLKDAESFACFYWETVVENMPLWQEVSSKTIGVGVLKEQYIVTQGIVIQALGRLGNSMTELSKSQIKKEMKGLRNVNWRRTAPCWKGRAVREDGRIISNNRAIVLICSEIKNRIGICLTEDEEYEDNLLKKGK